MLLVSRKIAPTIPKPGASVKKERKRNHGGDGEEGEDSTRRHRDLTEDTEEDFTPINTD
jgi:hypothetical protein